MNQELTTNNQQTFSLIDSHAHIQKDFFAGEIDQLVQRSKDAGIEAIVTIGTSLAESAEMLDLAQVYPGYLFPTVGLHPEDAAEDLSGRSFSELTRAFQELASKPEVVAIGECGLDYGKASDASEEEKERQKRLFSMQVEVAQDRALPLVVHCRNAWDDVFSLISASRSGLNVILHSFTGNRAVAQKALDLGYYMSFSGIVTFKNAQDLQEAARIVPLERMLVETDSPFLAPEPLRGSKNEPKNIIHTVQFLSELKGISLEEVASCTLRNTEQVFSIPKNSKACSA